jgi:predicted phosphodiesterase
MEACVRILVVSDLHSNAEALRAVFNRVRRKKFDQVVCLGDFVGYGAQPNQVLDTMRTVRAGKLYIRGNHDRVAAGIEDGLGFNHAAKHAALWTRDHLSAPNRHFLQELPCGPVRKDGYLICHGSPHDEDEYVFNDFHAAQVFAMHDAPVIFYGHTHLPVVFARDDKNRIRGTAIRDEAIVRLDPALRYLINPGSVGQPRDRNPMASFAMYDSSRHTVQFFRVEYDVEKTQTAILKAGLPRILADRLAHGT